MRTVRIVVVLAVLLAGCGSADEPAATDDLSPLAQVARIDDGVDVRVGAEERRVDDSVVPVRLGDAVRTDASGFAEVRYFSGSVARLDVLTEFTVVELADEPGASVVRAEMGVGRTWHRVRGLTGDDTYEVETGVAVATVRGTTFVVACPDVSECTFSVYEGLVEVRAGDGTVMLGSGEALTVREGETPGSPGDAPPLDDDPWLARNVELDGDGGAAGAEPPPGTPGDPTVARVEGTYAFSYEVETLIDDLAIPGDREVVGPLTALCPSGPCEVEAFLPPFFFGPFTHLGGGQYESEMRADGCDVLVITEVRFEVLEAELREGEHLATRISGEFRGYRGQWFNDCEDPTRELANIVTFEGVLVGGLESVSG